MAVKTDKCSFTVALKHASRDNPDTGTTSDDVYGEAGIYFGGYHQNLSSTGILSTDSSTTAYTDFNGAENTKKLLALETVQSDGQTANTITHSYDSGHFPAAICCWRYKTVGTEHGDGYLPAAGELKEGRYNDSNINTALDKCGGVKSKSTSYYIGCSTLYDFGYYAYYGWSLFWGFGEVTDYRLDGGFGQVRPFSAF